jgi:translocation and assembly module TamB
MRYWLALPFALLPLQAVADAAADKGLLTSWLEENLSGAGRTVTIDGFKGALSTRASLTQMTIADAQGVWLTLKDVTLDWSSSALLSGRIEISELSAGEIDLERIPKGDGTSKLPSPEAVPLALPELPVSIVLNGIAAHKIVLGAPVLGQKVEGSLSADLTLSGGEGTAHLDLLRQGAGPEGHVKLAAGYSNATKVLNLTLDAAEGAGGIAATLLHVPGAPATSLTIDGKGTMADFAAEVNLSTDGATRLAGQLVQKDDAAGNRSFSADLHGDPTPVFLPKYAAFFGHEVSLQAQGQRTADGALTLDSLEVKAQALTLHGSMALAANGQPQSLNFTGTLGLPDQPVTLPVATANPITVGSADFTLAYDAARSDVWRFGASVSKASGGSFAIGLARVTAEGRLKDQEFNGTANFTGLGVQATDGRLARAIGPTVTGSADFGWNSATSALQFDNLAVTAPGYAITTKGAVGTMATLHGQVSGHYDDLSRLSDLVGRPLSGALRFDVSGSAEPLTGAFDLTGNLLAQAVKTGVAQVDGLLAGDSRAEVSISRSTTGTEVRKLSLRAGGLAADVSGTLATAGSNLTGTFGLADLSVLGPSYHGRVEGSGTFTGTLAEGHLTGRAKGQDIAVGQPQADAVLAGASDLTLDTTFKDQVATIRAGQVSTPQGRVGFSGTASLADSALSATLTLPDLSVLGAGYGGKLTGTAEFAGKPDNGALTLDAKATDVRLGQGQVDSLLRGVSTAKVKLALTPDGVRIDSAEVGNRAVTASVTGTVKGTARDLLISARLPNLAVLYPQFPGPVSVTGTAVQGSDGTRLDLTARGPGQLNAALKGTLSPNYAQADLVLTGTAQAALANALIVPRSVDGALRFDLRLRGPLALASVSGPVSISGGRLADPSQTFGLKDMTGTATLGGGRAQVKLDAAVSSGGRIGVTGTVGLALPYTADLSINLNQVLLKDPELYATSVNGALAFRGPALGNAMISGAIALGRTELRIPSTGMGADGGLPGLKHVNDSAASKATRQRAGVGGPMVRGTRSAGYGLDISISAPNQVFIRGRGLDAELGGSLVLRGSTAAITPSGAFNLLRGRLDILGRRLVLSEALVQLQGALVPYVHIMASVESDGVTSSVLIAGEATDPVVTFTSSPQLPQEEVLARLLFNRGLDTISPFQAAQLASAAATLAGRGGAGVIDAVRRKTGLDNLDVQADASGNASVTAGKYLSDKTYSEVTVDQGGKSSISLNYDVTRHITLKAHVDSEGKTGVGAYLQRDY